MSDDLLDDDNGVEEETTETPISEVEGNVSVKLLQAAGEYEAGSFITCDAAELVAFLNASGASIMPKKEGTAKELICKLIKAKKSDEQILDAVAKQIPESAADKKHCTKYRRELFVAGEIDAALAAVRSEDHQSWAESNMAAAKRGPHKVYWIAKEKAAKEKAAAAKKAAADAKKAAAAKKTAAKGAGRGKKAA